MEQSLGEQSKDDNTQIEVDNTEKNTEDKNEDIQPVSTEVGTQVVTQNPIKENCNVEINGVKIKNETSFEINNSVLDTTLDISKENILIFHAGKRRSQRIIVIKDGFWLLCFDPIKMA